MKERWYSADGIHVDYVRDPHDDQFHINTWQDSEPIFEEAKWLQSLGRNFDTPWGHKIASVPVTVLMQWEKEDPDLKWDRKKLFKKLQQEGYVISKRKVWRPKGRR